MRDKRVAPRVRGSRKVARPISAAILMALLTLAGAAGTARSQQAPAPAPAPVPGDSAIPPQAEPPVQADVDEARGREQRVLRQVIFRDRQAQSTLDRAEAACCAGDAPRAVEALQQIL